ncbi:MAG: hypothetical protein JNM58_18460 [Xanthomonadaceae bacterium]|nr:hypothetical protein [Xanthomonadaceae bacterium]
MDRDQRVRDRAGCAEAQGAAVGDLKGGFVFDPIDEFGEFYTHFRIPRSLDWCDRETLMLFPLECGFDYTQQTRVPECNVLETECGGVLFVCDDAMRFRTGMLPLSEFRCSSAFFGVSPRAFDELGTVLEVEPALHSRDGFFLEGVWQLDRELARVLAQMPECEWERVAASWHETIMSIYQGEPVCARYGLWRPRWREYWLRSEEYALDGMTLDMLVEVLGDLIEVCRQRKGSEVVCIAFSR